MDSRPPPPQGAPPSYAFVTRMYRRNLRPVILTIAVLGALWSLFSGIGFFRNISFYNENGSSKLAMFSIVVGALYMGVFGIECIGIFGAMTQKLPIVRIYAFLSTITALIVAAVGLITIVIHFTLKNDILKTCTTINTGDVIRYGGFFGPVTTVVLSPQDAQDWCNRAYSHDSWSTIISFLITTVLAVFFSILAFSYMHQLLDPSSPANVAREPNRFQYRNYAPGVYNPPFSNSYGGQPGAGYGAPYPPPAGPPPGVGGHLEGYTPGGNKPAYVHDDEERVGTEDPNKPGYGWGERAP